MGIPTAVASHRYVCMYGGYRQDNKSFMIALIQQPADSSNSVAILLACCQCHEHRDTTGKTKYQNICLLLSKNQLSKLKQSIHSL